MVTELIEGQYRYIIYQNGLTNLIHSIQCMCIECVQTAY